MKRLIAILAGLLLALAAAPAFADNCSPYTYTFVNGAVADANQVNANFNNVLSCANVNLLGAANNLSDVASVPAARANLSAATITTTAWTPTVTFVTAGNLAVVYSTDSGSVMQVSAAGGSICYATFRIVTTTFTFTTAAGAFEITGLPIAPDATYQSQAIGGLGANWQGFTGLTFPPVVFTPGASVLELNKGANTASALDTTNFTTGANITLRGSFTYRC